MNIDEQLATDTTDPAMLELRKWRDEQRTPLSAEELERICEAASHGALLHIRGVVKTQLRFVISNELLIFVIGIVVGVVAGQFITL